MVSEILSGWCRQSGFGHVSFGVNHTQKEMSVPGWRKEVVVTSGLPKVGMAECEG